MRIEQKRKLKANHLHFTSRTIDNLTISLFSRNYSLFYLQT